MITSTIELPMLVASAVCLVYMQRRDQRFSLKPKSRRSFASGRLCRASGREPQTGRGSQWRREGRFPFARARSHEFQQDTFRRVDIHTQKSRFAWKPMTSFGFSPVAGSGRQAAGSPCQGGGLGLGGWWRAGNGGGSNNLV